MAKRKDKKQAADATPADLIAAAEAGGPADDLIARAMATGNDELVARVRKAAGR